MKKITDTSGVISLSTITRLCSLYKVLEQLETDNIRCVSSAELGAILGIGAHNIRKDISSVGVAGSSTSGYEVNRLKKLLAERLGFEKVMRACVVGLGRLGSAVLQHPPADDYRIVAAFDSNVNRLETLKTPVDLFPAYQITEVVKRLDIQVGIIAVPALSAQDVADRLVEGGIRGIVNFASVLIKPKNENIYIRNIDIGGEIRILSALFNVRSIT